MAVSEPDRHDLYQGMVEALGKKRAETFMNLVTTVPWTEVATKSDLERFATKSDLERFATKSDLERFATKEDLERMARKLVTWMASMTLGAAGLAFAAARLI